VTAGVFRLGVEQGLWCLGCCWALMLIMLAVGSMNVIWMAALTLFTFLEKTGSGRVTSRSSAQ
jgi:predicted metal-binding membrane protein